MQYQDIVYVEVIFVFHIILHWAKISIYAYECNFPMYNIL